MTNATTLLCIAAALMAAVAQWLLSSLGFSNSTGEWVFRGLYLLAHATGLVLSWVMGRRTAGRVAMMAVLLAPAVLSLVLQWHAVSGSDGQDAILLLGLPVLQLMATSVAAAALAARGSR